MNKSKIGLVIGIIGLFIIGLSIGNALGSEDSNLGLTFAGLFIVFIGVFLSSLTKKKLNK